MIKKITFWNLILLGCIFDSFAQVVTFPDSVKNEKSSIFPLMQGFKKKAMAAGAVFPKPYGVSGSMYFQKQSMDITRIKIGSLEIDEQGGIIDFANSNIQNTVVSSQVRADVWVLPFVNAYMMIGRVNTFNDIDLTINLSAQGNPVLPDDITLMKEKAIANVNGTVAGVGTVLAGGYGKVFVNANLTWAKTWLTEVNSTQTSFVAFPMVGVTTGFANFFVGGIYQNTGQVNKGSFLDSNGLPVSYNLEFNAERWNYAFGLNKFIGNWSFVLFQGFGARENSTVEIGYRFGK